MENSEIALLSISKAAKELHIGKDRIYKLLNEGRLGWVPMGNKRFIPYSEIIRFIKDSTQYTVNATEHFSWGGEGNMSSETASSEIDTVGIFNKLKETLI